MPTAHLLFGCPGSGKTTLARELEDRFRAVRFTPDEWMSRLFGDDPPAAIFAEKAAAIVELLEPIWARCLAIGVDVVLDFGFWRRAERDHAREVVLRHGGTALLYRLNCPIEEARRRVAARNAAGHAGLYIGPATFDQLLGRIEPLGDDEDCIEC